MMAVLTEYIFKFYIDLIYITDYLNEFSKNELLNYQKLREEYIKYSIYSNKITYGEIVSMSLTHKEQINNVINTAQKHFDDYTFNSYTVFFEHIEQKYVEGYHVFEEFFNNSNSISHVI